jgi:hypothetical protein
MHRDVIQLLTNVMAEVQIIMLLQVVFYWGKYKLGPVVRITHASPRHHLTLGALYQMIATPSIS